MKKLLLCTALVMCAGMACAQADNAPTVATTIALAAGG